MNWLVNVLHHPFDDLALRFGELVGRREDAAVLAAGDRLGVDAELVVNALHGQLAADDADRTGDGAGLGEDAVGAHRDVVAAAGGDVAHAGDDRLVDRLRLPPDEVAGQRRTAGAVDAEDDRFDRFILRGFLQGFDDGGRAHRRAADQAALALAAHDRADGVDDGDLRSAVAAAAAAFAHHRLEQLHHAHRAAEVGVDLLLGVVLDVNELVGLVLGSAARRGIGRGR